MKKNIILLTVVIISLNAYAINNLWRLNEDGDVIDGPTAFDESVSWYNDFGVSDIGYIYFYGEYDFICFDSDLSIVNTESTGSTKECFSIDNFRNEIIAPGSVNPGTVMRYGPTLDLLIELEVPGNLHYLTVDPSDGSIWYSTGTPGEYSIYKVTRDGDLVYYFPDEVYRGFTEVSPDGYFWGYESVYSIGLRLWDTEGNVHAEAAVECGWDLEIYFNDSSCWFLTDNPEGICKVNSSGSVVYLNSTDFDRPRDLAIDQTDGSVWIADTYNYNVVHLDQNGDELLRTDWDEELLAIAADPTNDTVVVISTPAHAVIEPTSVGRIKAMFR